MPHYDYECKKCGHRFEAFQQITDKPLTQCPKCQSKVKRLIGSGAGLIFKGSGFYATDYKKSQKSEAPTCNPSLACSTCPNNTNAAKKSSSKKPKK